ENALWLCTDRYRTESSGYGVVERCCRSGPVHIAVGADKYGFGREFRYVRDTQGRPRAGTHSFENPATGGEIVVDYPMPCEFVVARNRIGYVQSGQHAGEVVVDLVESQQGGEGVPECIPVGITLDPQQCSLRPGVVQHAGTDRVALGVVGLQ